ncbi:Actin-related protein 8, partial [Mucuna pruriens]
MDPNMKLMVKQGEPYSDPERPCIDHWAPVLRILRYIKKTPGQGLLYEDKGDTHISCYCNADWVGSPIDRRSTIGFCIFIERNVVSWKSKKQNTVAHSSAVAEYQAMASATCELIWVKQLIQELKFADVQPMKLLAMGLQQAIALCMDHCYSAELAGNNDWYKTVVLSGGTACLPGLAERLEKELHSMLPPFISNGIRVIPPPFGVDTAWFGGKIIGSLSTFPGPWCTTKKQFRQKSKLNGIW